MAKFELGQYVEEFQISKKDGKYVVKQGSTHVRNWQFILQQQMTIEQRLVQIKGEIKNLPDHKRKLEDEERLLKTRMKAIEPYRNELKVKLAREKKKQERFSKKMQKKREEEERKAREETK